MWHGELYGTLGPACCDAETIEQMIHEGMTGMRLNLSHSGLAESRAWIDALHLATRHAGKETELLIDMQGPEVRIDHFKGQISLSENKNVKISVRSAPAPGKDPAEIPVAPDIFRHLKPGRHLLLDDGKIELLVEAVSDRQILPPASLDPPAQTENVFSPTASLSVLCRVLRGGILTGGKSLKIVGEDLHRPALTIADLENIRAAKSMGVSVLMQPFVRSGEDLKEVRSALKEAGSPEIRIFAKIENREGMRNLDSILPEADMIVIARGDLGNDMPLWDLPAAQKEIEQKCIEYGRPFLVVTQMLSSMITNPVPTRAEVSDIFNAVADGASALMVTNETAVGQHPAEVIRYLKHTADSADAWKKRACRS